VAGTLTTLAALAAVAVRFGAGPQLPAFGYLALAGVPLAFLDARWRRLPDLLTLPSYPVALALLGLAVPFLHHGGTRLPHAVLGMAAALVLFGPFLVAAALAVSLAAGP
jgi:leader peptidase (prepilin peptidase)/N-methyltransferase